MTTVFAIALLLVFVLLEGRLRRGVAARSLEAGPADRGTTRRIGAAFGASFLALVLSLPLDALGYAVVPDVLAWLGVAVILIGIAGRVWAASVLGAAYTRTLRTLPQQRLVEKGPYRFVRHPGYASDIVMWLGAGLASGNWVAFAVIAAVITSAYLARIRAEERMLIDAFGEEYRAYSRRTWRLLPPLF